jgi:hypothetical protein
VNFVTSNQNVSIIYSGICCLDPSTISMFHLKEASASFYDSKGTGRYPRTCTCALLWDFLEHILNKFHECLVSDYF